MPNYAERRNALCALEQALLKSKNQFIDAIAGDFGGRAAEETLALELFPTLAEIRYAVSHLKGWMEPRRVPVSWQFWPGRAQVLYQPLGVVGILSAWNYPLFLSLVPLANALAAGNHVMLKPSEFAPRTGELLASLVADLFPPEYVSVVQGEADTGTAFSELPFDHLLFTGSGRVGKLVMRAASENLTPVTLELGGKSPALIHREYPLETAAERILAAKLYNTGQTCVAPDYVLVHQDGSQKFIELARKIIVRMYPCLQGNPDYTRIINARQYRRLSALVEDARAKGGSVIEINPAAEKCDELNQVFAPCLVTGIQADMAVMQEEIFGPILPVVVYQTLEEALEFVNTRPHPLAFYYFDRNRGRVRQVLEKTFAGGVTVNDCMFHVGQCGLPFGGVGPSGMGKYHGFDGFETFSKKKGVFFEGPWSALSLLRPPYGAGARRILRFIVGA